MRASEAEMTVLDFEATGSVGSHPNEPWQIGLVRFAAGRVVEQPVFESLLRVGDRPFSRHAPGRHADLRDGLRTAPRLPDLWPTLKPWIDGRPLVAHHAATEKRFLADAYPLRLMGPWVDTLKLARLAFPQLASHKLGDILAALGIAGQVEKLAPGRQPHDALYDAAGAAVLLQYLFELPTWRNVSLDALSRARPARYHSLRGGRRGAAAQ